MDEQTPAPQQTTQAAPQAAGPVAVAIPEVWPGAWGIYKTSKQAMKQNWPVLLGLLILQVIVGYVPALLLGRAGNAIGNLLDIPVSIALVVAYLATVRGQKPTLGGALSAGVDPMMFLKYLANAFLVAAVLVVSFILLIVPFFFVLPRLSLATYFLIDKKMGPVEAMKASWAATKGHSGKVWGIIGVSFVFGLLILAVFVGLYFIFMYGAAIAILYEYINKHQAMEPASSPVPAPEPQAPVQQ